MIPSVTPREAADVAEGLREEDDLPGGGEIRLGDDLEEGRAGAVEIDDGEVDGGAAGRVVEELAGVLFEVGADDADAARGKVVVDGVVIMEVREVNGAVEAEGELVLGDLVVLGHVGVEVTLAVPAALGGDAAFEGHADHHGHLDGGAVHHRQGAGEAEDDGVNEGVRGGAVVFDGRRVGGAGEHLGARGQLDVHLEADLQLGLDDGGHAGMVSEKESLTEARGSQSFRPPPCRLTGCGRGGSIGHAESGAGDAIVCGGIPPA